MAVPKYDRAYFDSHSRAARRSAEVIVPLVMEMLSPRSVCDVGCGPGIWLAAFEEQGVTEVVGVDGDYVDREALRIDPTKFVAADLEHGIPKVGRFDLTVSLEVAEHLPESASARFVEGLVGLAPAVLFAAAVPGQAGRGHVNEQWPTYWGRLFQEHQYRPVDLVRPRVWESGKVKPWYRQNMILFADPSVIRSNAVLQEERQHTAARPLSLVHPQMFHLALQRPLTLWRRWTAEVEQGRLTQEELHERTTRMLERFAPDEKEDR